MWFMASRSFVGFTSTTTRISTAFCVNAWVFWFGGPSASQKGVFVLNLNWNYFGGFGIGPNHLKKTRRRRCWKNYPEFVGRGVVFFITKLRYLKYINTKMYMDAHFEMLSGELDRKIGLNTHTLLHLSDRLKKITAQNPVSHEWNAMKQRKIR